jgi:cysteine synthase
MPPRTPFGSPLDTAAQSLTRDAARDRCFRRSSSGAQAVQSSRGATAIGLAFGAHGRHVRVRAGAIV